MPGVFARRTVGGEAAGVKIQCWQGADVWQETMVRSNLPTRMEDDEMMESERGWEEKQEEGQ